MTVPQSPHNLPGPVSPGRSLQQLLPPPACLQACDASRQALLAHPASASSYPKLGLMLTWCMPSTVRMSLPRHTDMLQLTQ